jgi:NAD(P)-dependent dehydrogenase (short-subunit alcohol dehydrogenase family)
MPSPFVGTEQTEQTGLYRISFELASLSIESSPQERVVAVYGAAGHTGRFVVAELERRGFVPVAVARDEAKLAVSDFGARGVETRLASIDDPESLDRALSDVAAVINCAGPFGETAEPVAAAAVRRGIHYLDVTAEQPSAQATFERFHAAARKRGVVVLPAMGFYGGLADLLVTAAAGEWDSVDDVRVVVALDSWQPTLGTRITGYRNTAARLTVVAGELRAIPQPPTELVLELPEPFGRQPVVELSFSEVVVITRHLRVGRLHSYINQEPLRDLRDPTTPPPRIDESGRSPQVFLLEARLQRGTQLRRAIVRGRDIYAVTAPLVCEAVARILAGSVRRTGAVAPGEAFDAPEFLAALSPQELTVEIGEPGPFCS